MRECGRPPRDLLRRRRAGSGAALTSAAAPRKRRRSMTPLPPDDARAEVTELVPLYERFARDLASARLRLCEAEQARSAPLYEKTLRYERIVGRLGNRIRFATVTLAQHAG
jgi:hypothetical protein